MSKRSCMAISCCAPNLAPAPSWADRQLCPQPLQSWNGHYMIWGSLQTQPELIFVFILLLSSIWHKQLELMHGAREMSPDSGCRRTNTYNTTRAEIESLIDVRSLSVRLSVCHTQTNTNALLSRSSELFFRALSVPTANCAAFAR